MVKKLFKHEIISYLRIWLPTQAILLGIALLGRIIQLFESNTTAYDIVSGSSIFTYVIAIIAAVGLTVALGIIRFYKNLFTGEGYLTFTLPVTPSQHIIVKAVTAALFLISTIIVVLLSVCIMTAGDVLSEIIKAASYLLDLLKPAIGIHLPLYVIELIILLIIAFHAEFLYYYTCISIGQLFRKNRILAAVGVYFGFYIISQIIGTIFIVITSVWAVNLPMDKIAAFVEAHIIGLIHGAFGVMILFTLIFALIYFVVIKTIIKRRLNLE